MLLAHVFCGIVRWGGFASRTLVSGCTVRRRDIASRADEAFASRAGDLNARPLYAVLVDAENARYKDLANILQEIARLGGDASVRRVYGDFSKEQHRPWKKTSLDLSFRTVNAFSYVSGKGSSDATMIIDAMDYLYSNPSIAGFAIVSSDSDFTPLAQRLREAGKRVLGFGEKHTPVPFVTACERFVYTEKLRSGSCREGAAREGAANENKSTSQRESKALDPDTLAVLCRAVGDLAGEDGWADLSRVGALVNSLKNDFDPRSFGHRSLCRLMVSQSTTFEVKRNAGNGSQNYAKLSLRGDN